MCVEILIASYLRGHCQFEVPWGCEFWYNLALVDFPCQFEVPWGWDLRKKHALVHIPRHTLVHTARQFEIPWCWKIDIILPLCTPHVNLKFYWRGNLDITLLLFTFPVNL
jgi:hypothetical protein